LTIDAAGTRLALFAGRHTHIAAEQIVHALPGAVFPPAPKVLIDNLPGRKVVGQQAPRAATTEDIEDRIDDFTLRIFLGPPTGFGWGDQMCDQLPFFVAQVGRVRFAGFHAPRLTHFIPG
jgi:hypothetical protein